MNEETHELLDIQMCVYLMSISKLQQLPAKTRITISSSVQYSNTTLIFEENLQLTKLPHEGKKRGCSVHIFNQKSH